MKLQVLQENLSRALSITSRFASTRAQLPVLSNVLLSAKKNKLLVSSTNLEISVSLSIGAKVEKGGEITIPAKVISDLVSNLKPGSVDLLSKKERLKISTSNFSSEIPGMNSSDFPAVPQDIGKGALGFPKENFQNALSQVLFAASIDETRPVLTGILFIFDKGKLVLVSTDGFRLSQKKLSLKVPRRVLAQLGPRGKQRLILPKSILSELSRLTNDDEDIKFLLREKESQVVFGISDAVLASRVIDGEFPDFEKIIPKELNYKINLDKEEFLRAIKLASVFARDSANVVKITVKKASLEVSAESSQSGSQETQVDAKVDGKEGLKIAFNYRFLEDFLNVVKGDEVQIELSSADSPGVFIDPKERDFLHLIMPVRIQA